MNKVLRSMGVAALVLFAAGCGRNTPSLPANGGALKTIAAGGLVEPAAKSA